MQQEMIGERGEPKAIENMNLIRLWRTSALGGSCLARLFLGHISGTPQAFRLRGSPGIHRCEPRRSPPRPSYLWNGALDVQTDAAAGRWLYRYSAFRFYPGEHER